MILVIGTLVAREACVAEALALSLEHVARSRAEPGCLSHAVSRDAEQPARFVFVEHWASREALWAHFAAPASRAAVRALGALAAEAPTLRIYDASEIPVPRRGGA